MGLEYFKDQIEEELCGAKDYVKKAIEVRAMNLTWGKTLYEMSIEELEHATKLYKMFEEYYMKLSATYDNNPPEYLTNIRAEILECVTEKTAKVRYLQDMFNK